MSSAVTLATKYDLESLKNTVRTFMPDGEVREVRVPKAGKQGTISGYFDNRKKLLEALADLSGEYEGVYITLNPVNPDLIALANNRWKPYAHITTADPDIIWRHWLLIDIDSKRKAGISSSDEEKSGSKALAEQVRGHLTAQGWAEPLLCDSGNGWHLLYRIDLPNDDASRDLIHAMLDSIAGMFDTPTQHVDTTVHNASRIVKAYGTMSCKGDSIPSRPHRIGMMPGHGELGLISSAQLQAVASLLAPPEAPSSGTKRKGDYTPELTKKALAHGMVTHKSGIEWHGGMKFHHPCPRNPDDHKGTDCYTYCDKAGWVSCFCSHASCEGLGMNTREWEKWIEERVGSPFPEKPQWWKNAVNGFGVEEAPMDWGASAGDAPCVAPKEKVAARKFDRDGFGNAERFELRHGKGEFLYAKATGWMAYQGGRWLLNKVGKAEQGAWETIRHIPDELPLCEGDDEVKALLSFAHQSASHAGRDNLLSLASALPTFARDYADFDQRRDLFLCANGVYHFDSDEFTPHDPAYMLTKGSGIVYDPSATCPDWERILLEVMDGKQHMVDYLQRCGGYSLTPDTGEQAVFISYGAGGTGKGTWFGVMKGIMGDYARPADSEMLMAKRGDSGQPFEMAGMEGVRALLASETEKGKTLAVAKLKKMSGQDPITACYKFHDSYEFMPDWKIWFATNDRPNIPNADDDAWWQRVKVIGFNVQFRNTEKQIRNLAQTLLATEGSGILNWFLQGFKEWKRGGLRHPEEVAIAVRDWQETEDYMSRFLEERMEKTTNPREYVLRSEAFEIFGRWSGVTKEGVGISLKDFTQRMRNKKFADKSIRRDGASVKIWEGLKPSYSHREPSMDDDDVT